jgi:hypothetical protein
MDYKAIYDRFIQSRRENPPKESEYFERHHIVPRCMDGGDDPENIIPLTPEDHFFAHLCLAKAYRSRSLWAAVWIMVHDRKHDGKNKSWANLRNEYGFLQRRRLSGVNHPMADVQSHKFYHIDGDTFEGTRVAFAETYKIPAASVNTLFYGSLQCYGWSLRKLTRKELVSISSDRARKNGKQLSGYVRDKKEYCFYNIKTGQSFLGTQSDMCSKHLSRQNTSAICMGDRILTRNGWCLEQKKHIAYQYACRPGELNHRFNKKKFNFCHISGNNEKNTTIWEMGQKYFNGDSRAIGEVASGRKNGCRGWYLEGNPKPRIMNAKYTMINKDGEKITGTISSLCDAIGVTKTSVCRVVKGKTTKTKGWRLNIEKI